MSKMLVAPIEALTDSSLTDQERRVLFALFSFRGRLTENVWPTREQIGERANIKDLAAVGKRTTSLAKKGWLLKFKKGFSGHMTYTLTFPERLNALEVESTSIDETPLEAESTSHTRSNPPLHTGSNLPSALNKPLNKPSKQTIYKKITLDLDDPLIFLYKEFIEYRIGLKRPLTQQMFNRFLGVVQVRCGELGQTPEWVITETIDAGWRSCKPEWLRNRTATNRPATNFKPDSIKNGPSIEEKLTDRGWANEGFGSDAPVVDERVLEGNFIN